MEFKIIKLDDIAGSKLPLDVEQVKIIARAICIALNDDNMFDAGNKNFAQGYALALADVLGCKGIPAFIKDAAFGRVDIILRDIWEIFGITKLLEQRMKKEEL